MRVKIHHEGTNILWALLAILLVVNAPLWIWVRPLGWAIATTAISAVFYLLVVNFFRSPRRMFKGDSHNAVVASADGTVVALEETYENEYLHCRCIQLSVFMSVLNVHANWFPVDGEVVHTAYHPGRFMAAYLPKSSTENERSTVVIRTPEGQQVLMRQIAGAMARRIVTYARPGDEASVEDHMGFIKFGSRVDLYLPLGTDIYVKIGDKTPVASLKLACCAQKPKPKMLRRTTSQLPNSVTCLNLISGCIAIFMSFHLNDRIGPLTGGSWAMIAMGVAAVFDFLDGATARLLHKFSPLGKDLDSLSDLVSFGVAPAMLVSNIMTSYGNPLTVAWIPLMIAVCGAIRLATFNTDTEQAVNFRGLPIPANAVFWIGVYGWIRTYGYPGWGVMAVLIVLVSLAMVGRFKMFSLKFKNFDIGENFSRYALIVAAILFVVFNGLSGLMWTILFYFFLSMLKRKHL